MLINDKTPPTTLPVSLTKGGGNSAPGAGNLNASGAFAQTLQQLSQAGTSKSPNLVTIKGGDTLIGLVRQQAVVQGVAIRPDQEMRIAQQIAQDNGIRNPNCIFPGQKISFNALLSENPAVQAMAPAAVDSLVVPAAVKLIAKVAAPDKRAHPVLDKTLERAVAKGFIPLSEKSAVYDKILQIANTHKFKPDDFARMTLMESDGMNPRASNQRCHGIIQFCDGPSRGAASAGYAANPRAILDLSVHKQLGLVDKYFEDVGLKNKGPAGLEDLYLSVLHPAARSETQADASLKIPGVQSSYLYQGHDTGAQITRQSIRQGLLNNAAERLGQMLAPVPRLQAMRASKYNDNAQN